MKRISNVWLTKFYTWFWSKYNLNSMDLNIYQIFRNKETCWPWWQLWGWIFFFHDPRATKYFPRVEWRTKLYNPSSSDPYARLFVLLSHLHLVIHNHYARSWTNLMLQTRSSSQHSILPNFHLKKLDEYWNYCYHS